MVDSVKLGLCGGTVIRWAYVGGSDQVGLCGDECEGGLMWARVLKWAYVGGSAKGGLCGDSVKVGFC